LTPASGRQDHATSPSALTFRKSLLDGFGTSPPKLWGRRISAARLAPLPRPPHPAPNVRDDREAPLLRGRMARKMLVIWGCGKAEYFCGRDWTTTQITLKRLRQLQLA
jgi:hypothetical protein